MSFYLALIGAAAAVTAMLSFWFVTREIRRGTIRRAPKMSIARACTTIMRRERER